MLLDSIPTFLFLDAAAWTAIGTFALVVVTWVLWGSQRKYNEQTREMFELINRPIVYVKDLKFIEKGTEIRQLQFSIVNSGRTTADIIITTNCVEKDEDDALSLKNDVLSEKTTIYPGFSVIRLLPIDKKFDGDEMFSCLRLQYQGLRNETIKYVLLIKFNNEINNFAIIKTETTID